MSAPTDVVQQVLAAEHATVYGYGVVGGAVAGDARAAALRALDQHRARRDRLRAMVVEAGAAPAEAAPAYALPPALDTPADAVALAARLERDVALAYGALVAAATGEERAFAARSLQDAAVRAALWRGEAARFPGLPVSA